MTPRWKFWLIGGLVIAVLAAAIYFPILRRRVKSTERRELERLVPTDLGLMMVPCISGLGSSRTEFRLKVFGRYCSVAPGVAPAKPCKPYNF